MHVVVSAAITVSEHLSSGWSNACQWILPSLKTVLYIPKCHPWVINISGILWLHKPYVLDISFLSLKLIKLWHHNFSECASEETTLVGNVHLARIMELIEAQPKFFSFLLHTCLEL